MISSLRVFGSVNVNKWPMTFPSVLILHGFQVWVELLDTSSHHTLILMWFLLSD